ncbi:uncharacterized protein LOC126743950 [Anthonomus grandis grandis]|uniref:uncharacterized protein LOC126743950 n=1 Tax=Anthonomus grandis grandis TaxID=2921223 RepID=UPI0021653CFA|nr:uncharacterized protein LOC126743950 [Anthonomus grandis grandis]
MAAPRSSRKTKGRSPDTPFFTRKNANSRSVTYAYATKTLSTIPFQVKSKETFCIRYGDMIEENLMLDNDTNKNTFHKLDKSLLKHSFPKILFLKKNSDDVTDTMQTLDPLEDLDYNTNNGNKSDISASDNLSLDNKNEPSTATHSLHQELHDDYSKEKQKNRNSFHQNVEEALSSLLWQPYEYQTHNSNDAYNGNYESYDYESFSTCSYTPSSSPISLDLDDTSDNTAPSPSNTKKNVPSSTFLQCTAAVPPPYRRDLHSDVINLNRQETTNQSEQVFAPRDRLLQRSGNGAFVSLASLASSLLDAEYGIVPHVDSVTSCFGEFSGNTSMYGGGSGGAGAQQNNGSTSGGTADNAFNSVDLSLNAANIVGLPSSHARYASVPCGGTSTNFQNAHAVTRSQNVVGYPQHYRHISEPSQQFFKYSGSSQQVPSLSQKSNQSGSTQLEQHNLQLINHFRSSSVPKSMTLVSKYDVTANSIPPSGSLRVKGPQVISQNSLSSNGESNSNKIKVATNVKASNISVPSPLKLQPASSISSVFPSNPSGNVSNVNVNFYRAVPVNVVSSVPTIHCLNTLGNNQGNSVSNVQVLPLGNGNFPHNTSVNQNSQLPVRGSAPEGLQNNSGQVIVHNVNPVYTSNNYPHRIITSNIGYPDTTQGSIISQNIAGPSTDNNNSTSTALGDSIEVSYQPAGRVITTTAQINSGPSSSTNLSGTPLVIQKPPATSNPPTVVRTRTFTSTEAQTDDISPIPDNTQNQNAALKEQRRRERRERRHHRRNQQNAPRNATSSATQTQPPQNNLQENRLPDILNSHLPPPYTTMPNNQTASMLPPQIIPPPPPLLPGALLPNPPGPVLQTVVPNGVPASAFVFPAPQQIAPLMQGGAPVPVSVPATAASGFRFGFPANGFRRSRYSEDSPKGCCGFLTWKPGSLRWFIALIALVAVCCVLVGTALGAMRPAGRDHLTVSLLMIGVGIVLITVSGVAWRLTSHDSSTCRSMLGLGSTESVDVCTRRFVPRLPPSYGRPHHPYAAMMYPEFQYRPPPPSYQASMQEYRLRLLLLDRGNTPQIQTGVQNTISPPPTYRSHAGSLLRAPLSSRREANQSEYSCPPSYRSQNSSNNRQGTLSNASILHSRDPSLTMSDSNHESVVNVVNILNSAEEDIALDNITLDSLKMEPEPPEINPLKMLLKGSQSDLEGSKDGNLVTIVQTSDQNPVIVTVSGCSAQDHNSTVQITEIPSEMEILAHL